MGNKYYLWGTETKADLVILVEHKLYCGVQGILKLQYWARCQNNYRIFQYGGKHQLAPKFCDQILEWCSSFSQQLHDNINNMNKV